MGQNICPIRRKSNFVFPIAFRCLAIHLFLFTSSFKWCGCMCNYLQLLHRYSRIAGKIRSIDLSVMIQQQSSSILIIGATGQVGSFVVKHLKELVPSTTKLLCTTSKDPPPSTSGKRFQPSSSLQSLPSKPIRPLAIYFCMST